MDDLPTYEQLKSALDFTRGMNDLGANLQHYVQGCYRRVLKKLEFGKDQPDPKDLEIALEYYELLCEMRKN